MEAVGSFMDAATATATSLLGDTATLLLSRPFDRCAGRLTLHEVDGMLGIVQRTQDASERAIACNSLPDMTLVTFALPEAITE